MLKRKRSRRKNTGFWFVVILLFIIAMAITARPADVLRKYNVSYGIYDLKKDNLQVVPMIAQSEYGENSEKMIRHAKPLAAIAGTYFDEDYKPLGDILDKGKLINKGYQKQAIGFTRSGDIVFLQRGRNRKFNWSGIESGIACGPRLLKNGKYDIDCERDGFSCSANQLLASRCAIGKDKKGRLVLCAVPTRISLNTLAAIMQRLGAVDAINLDGGRSCFLYSRGKYLQSTVSPMSNLITVRNR